MAKWWKLQLAKTLLRLNKFQESETLFRELLQDSSSKDLQLTLWLGRLYSTAGKYGKAEKCLTEALNVDPNSKQLRLVLAQVMEERGKWENSSSILERVISLDPTDPEALSLLAANYFYDEQPELSKVCYERMLDLGHSYSSAVWNNYGLCKFYCGDLDAVHGCFEEALDVATDNIERADVWFNMSHVAIRCGDLEWARGCLRLTVHYDPTHAEAYNNMAVIGNIPHQTLHGLLELSMKHGPNLFEPFYNAALLDSHQGRLESALKYARMAQNNFPVHFDKSAFLGSLLAEINEL